MTLKSASIAALLLAVSTVAASADTVFNFTANATGFSVAGEFVGTYTAGVFDITNITGAVTEGIFPASNSYLITGLVPSSAPGTITAANGSVGTFDFDNVYYPDPSTPPNNIYDSLSPSSSTTPAFDYEGLLFTLSNGTDVNLFSNNGNVYIDDSATFAVNGAMLASESVVALATPGSAAPEPSSLVLLGTGILGLAGAARRRLTR